MEETTPIAQQITTQKSSPIVQQTSPSIPTKTKKRIPILLTISIILLIIILFSPMPYYQTEEVICKMGQTCPKPGWYAQKSLFQNIISFLSHSSQVQSIQNSPPTPTPVSDPTATWKTYTNSEFSFKYPDTWIVEDKKISSNDRAIELWAFMTDDPMYNECMKLTDTSVAGNITVKSFSGIHTPEMCDSINLNLKEKWIVATSGKGYAPGLQYSFKENDPAAETIFTQILSTFKFIQQEVPSSSLESAQPNP